MTPDDLHTSLANRPVEECAWFHFAAVACWNQGRYQMIPSRDGKSLYLARFWLTAPRMMDTGSDGARFESGNSLLLHYFAQGDDDGALHDHPWEDFTTVVVSGGYTERRPPKFWQRDREPWADRCPAYVGVPFNTCELLERRPGGARERRLGCNQHAVEGVLPETWTVLSTGPRVRQWGFQPPGRSWMPWTDFLSEKLGAA